MADVKKSFNSLKNLAFLSQLGLSLVLPLILLLMLASYLQSRFGVGDWVMPAALIVGLAMGMSSFIGFLRYAYNESKKSERGDD